MKFMILLIIAFLIIWFLRTIKAILFHLYIWQLKEYRIDRLWDYLKLRKSQNEIFDLLFLGRFIVLPFLIEGGEFALLGIIIVPIIFILEISQGFYQILKKRFKKPKFTLKSTAIFLVMMSLHFILIPTIAADFIYPKACIGFACNNIWSTIFISLSSTYLIPVLILTIILLLKPITFLVKKYYYHQATQKVATFKNLTVIGITGSYGKTTTKEFLYTILSKKYKVLKTDKHNNTEIGVAQTVLKKLKPEHQIFIVEMGAYKRGEIKTICDIVKPNIGILTGINEQHVSLFGSLENIKKGKYELIESLPKNGLAVFNGDNEHCRQLADKTKINKMIFSVEHKANVYADQIDVKPTELSFLLYFGENCRKVEARLAGHHNIPNILAAACATLHIGMSLEEVDAAIKHLQPIEKTMAIIQTANNLTIVDDSYNANPDGVIAAITHLNTFPTETSKVIIMPSMLELGSHSAEAHQRVGQKIGQTCDVAIFLDAEQINNLSQGISENKSSKTIIFQENNPEKILEIINQKIKKPAVILFESRGAERVINKLLAFS